MQHNFDRADNFIKLIIWQVHEWSCHFNDITCLSQFHANLIYFGQSCSNAHLERRNFIVSPTLWVVFRRLGMKCFLHLKPVTRFTKLELNKPSECWIPTFSISGNLSTTSSSQLTMHQANVSSHGQWSPPDTIIWFILVDWEPSKAGPYYCCRVSTIDLTLIHQIFTDPMLGNEVF